MSWGKDCKKQWFPLEGLTLAGTEEDGELRLVLTYTENWGRLWAARKSILKTPSRETNNKQKISVY